MSHNHYLAAVFLICGASVALIFGSISMAGTGHWKLRSWMTGAGFSGLGFAFLMCVYAVWVGL